MYPSDESVLTLFYMEVFMDPPILLRDAGVCAGACWGALSVSSLFWLLLQTQSPAKHQTNVHEAVCDLHR